MAHSSPTKRVSIAVVTLAVPLLAACVGSPEPSPPARGVYGHYERSGGDTFPGPGSSAAAGELVCVAVAGMGESDPAPACATTDADGNYTLELDPGSYVLCLGGRSGASVVLSCDDCAMEISEGTQVRRDVESGQVGVVFTATSACARTVL